MIESELLYFSVLLQELPFDMEKVSSDLASSDLSGENMVILKGNVT